MQDKYGGIVTGPLDVRVWLRMLSCVTIIEKRLRRNFAERFDTTLPRFDVMATLDRRPEGQTMGELSRALLVSNGNVTAIVRQLVEQGLAASSPDPADRRSSIVALTAQGKVQFDEMARVHHQWIRQALAGFPGDQQAQLFELLATLKLSIAKE
jgi:DNA-binding MarR family transcriptional regulator